MKILFQGGWKLGRNPAETEGLTKEYCTVFAQFIVSHGHQVVLTSNQDYDKLIADTIAQLSHEQNKNTKDYLLFLLPKDGTKIPSIGRVKQVEESQSYLGKRTYLVENADVVVAIGGGRGTQDCVEKASLLNKPVFVATAISSQATDAWRKRKKDYKYLTEEEIEYLDDLSLTPEEFFEKIFQIIGSLEEKKYKRGIFIVHGHDLYFKDSLVTLLKQLDFEPIVLQDEQNEGLTILEKLEKYTGKVGFAFILYTPDDLGHLVGEAEQKRARQNVVFEHGLLMGLLGRERTCAIVKSDLEIPSDIKGMLYEEIDNINDKRLKIAQILKGAKYRVDASRLLEV